MNMNTKIMDKKQREKAEVFQTVQKLYKNHKVSKKVLYEDKGQNFTKEVKTIKMTLQMKKNTIEIPEL